MQSSMPFSFNCGPGLKNEPGPLLLFCQGLSGLLFRPGHYSSMVYYSALYGCLEAWEGINNNPNGNLDGQDGISAALNGKYGPPQGLGCLSYMHAVLRTL